MPHPWLFCLSRRPGRAAVMVLLAMLAWVVAACRGRADLAATEPEVVAPAATRPANVVEQATAVPGSIAVLLPDDAPDSRWGAHDGPALARCLSEAGATFTLHSAGGDGDTQIAQAVEAIAAGARVLLLAGVDNAAGAAVVDTAHAQGIKVIDYDRLTTGSVGADLYVGFDPTAAGHLLAETLAPYVRALPVARRNVILLGGPAGDATAERVGAGIRAVVEPYFASGQWSLLADVAAQDVTEAQTRLATLLADESVPVGAVFATDDGLAGAVADVLRQQDRDPARLGGRGATLAALQRIIAGEQTVTLYEPRGPLSDAACQAAVAVLNGDEVVSLTTRAIDNGAGEVPFIRLSPIVVTEDNLAETVIADGVATWAEICAGELVGTCPAD